MLGSGGDLREVLRHLEITGSTWRRWRRVALRPSCVSGCGTSLSDLPRIKLLNAVDELIARPSLSQPPTASTPEPRSRTGEVEYHTYRSHQSLGGLTPAAHADHWKTHQHQPTHL